MLMVNFSELNFHRSQIFPHEICLRWERWTWCACTVLAAFTNSHECNFDFRNNFSHLTVIYSIEFFPSTWLMTYHECLVKFNLLHYIMNRDVPQRPVCIHREKRIKSSLLATGFDLPVTWFMLWLIFGTFSQLKFCHVKGTSTSRRVIVIDDCRC